MLGSKLIISLLFLLQPLSTLTSFYCPYQHRHLGRNILRLEGGGQGGGLGHIEVSHQEYNVTTEPVVLPQPSFWKSENSRYFKIKQH